MSQPVEIIGCDEVDDRLEAFLDGDLDATEAAAVAGHLNRCTRCETEHRLARDLLSELRALPRPDAPGSVLEGIRAEVDAEPLRFRTWSDGLPLRGLAAAVVALAIFGGVLWQANRTPTGPSDAEIARATDQAKYALALVGAVSFDVAGGDLLRDRVLSPALRGVSKGFENRMVLFAAPKGPKQTTKKTTGRKL